MKTIARYQPGLVAADTNVNVKQIPAGRMWLTLVTVEVVELDASSAKDMDGTQFTLLPGVPSLIEDGGGEDAKVKANLFRRACIQIAGNIQSNAEHFRIK